MVHQLDSFKRAASADSTALAISKESASTKNQYQSSGTSSKSVTTTSNTTQSGTTAQKKGWSSAANGAIIGGVIGARTGYFKGREQDKKSGRVKQ